MEYIERYIRGLLLRGFGSWGYGGWEVPHLLSTGWRPGKAGGMISLSPKASELGANGINPDLSLSTPEPMFKGRRRWLFQFKQRWMVSFRYLFVWVGLSMDQVIPHVRTSVILTSPVQMPISSRNAPIDIPRRNVLLAIWAAFRPSNLMHINHHVFFIRFQLHN